MSQKKKGVFQRLFSKKSFDEDDVKKADHKPRITKQDAIEASTSQGSSPFFDQSIANAPVGLKKQRAPAKAKAAYDKPANERTRKISTAKKKKNRKESNVHINPERALEFPCTPELILEYHKRKEFLSQNEEWLLVELNEYECLVENEEIIKIIAKHSKFFEVDPDELWEEFFEFVEEMPSYDEVINYDVWQEFRDKKYLCWNNDSKCALKIMPIYVVGKYPYRKSQDMRFIGSIKL